MFIRVPKGILLQTTFAKYVETKKFLFLREKSGHFAEFPISYYETDQNKTNDTKKYIYTI
jgi:hypothetical protein